MRNLISTSTKALVTFALALAILYPNAAFAAWAATETFESYSNGANMNGASGGSGWTDNWATAGSTWIASTGSSYQGTVGARTTTSFMQRNFTAISSGTVTLYVALKRTVRGANDSRVYVQNTAQNGGIGIHFTTGGNITVERSGGADTIVTSYTADQWYVFRITINRDAWTASVDYSTSAYGTAGTWTTGVTNVAMFGSASNLTNYRYECDNLTGGGLYYTDYISPTSPFTAAAAAPALLQAYSFWW